MVTNMLQHYITKKRKYINHHGNKITNNTITILVYDSVIFPLHHLVILCTLVSH
jgi:hypothetical protein